MVPVAYLRVFQPLESFSPDEQQRWERYLADGSARPMRRRWSQRVTTGKLGLLSPADGEHADIRMIEGRTYLCPWRTRLRVLAGLLSLREADVVELADQFVPQAEARRARRELARMRRRDPGAISFIHEAAWHVPVRWFILFEDEERRLLQRRDGTWRLRYRTTTGRAMRRAERFTPVLRRAELDPIADMIVELYEWMSRFDSTSLLELDYGGLTDLMSWDELDDDHSARDIQEALAGLARGEFPRSAEIYQGVIGRWAEVRGHESLN
jgi:hypothetical protein